MARIVWLSTGMAWAARSMLEFSHPEYYSPATVLDWSAVWSYSAAWLLFAPSVVLLGRLTSSQSVRAMVTVVAIGAVLAGGANAIEDGFAVSIGGTPYVVGFMVALLSLIPLAGFLWRAKALRLAVLTIALFFGILLAFGFAGGLIILGGLGALAVAPGWFRRLSGTAVRHGRRWPQGPRAPLRVSPNEGPAASRWQHGQPRRRSPRPRPGQPWR